MSESKISEILNVASTAYRGVNLLALLGACGIDFIGNNFLLENGDIRHTLSSFSNTCV